MSAPDCVCAGEGPDYHVAGCRWRTHWNYRTCVQRTDDGPIYTVREVYYGPGDSLSWTADACYPQGDTWMEMYEDLSLMTSGAATLPILDITEAPGVWVDRKGNPA